MSLDGKFKALIRDLNQTALEELNRLVASELGRHATSGFRIDEIHPRMTSAEKRRAADEIGRILEEQQ